RHSLLPAANRGIPENLCEAPGDRQGVEVQVPCDEGVAIHIGPESCAVAREGLGEALTGVRIGQPLSRESFLFWLPTPCI
ncbi:MAG: hypothetical protein WCC90_00405, partial [Methylocella sp.]